ncbi:MAG: DUF885 family protein [Caulobacteraceae bacterium]|nr:DUF885 family protein [Caulobacteraceae bacterium]
MLDRRRFLMSAAAGAALAGAAGVAHARADAPANGEAAKLNALFDKIFKTELAESPEFQTGIGMVVVPGSNAKLDDRSPAAEAASWERQRSYDRDLKAIDRSKLSGMDLVNYDTVKYQGESSLEGARFGYGVPGYPAPYRISQLTGAYQGIPDFLDSQHQIEKGEDAEAYLSRMNDFATALDAETGKARADGAKGVVPPDFILKTALTQLRALRGTPTAQTTLVASVTNRAKAKNLAGDWQGRASAIVDQKIFPALDRQIALLEGWQASATHDAGVWRLPMGEDYYRWGAKFSTTTNMTPDEIHQMGLQQVAEISARADAILKAQGMSQGTVGQRISAAMQKPEFIYPNTDEGKEQLLKDLNAQVAAMQARLPQHFGTLPKAKLDIRRVPVAIEAGAPGGYYNGAALDGSRPGAYYINLRNTKEWPKPTLPTLTYHEGIPGHHLQISLSQEAQGIPILRRIVGFSSYSEGWALYSEQLADEMGVYENDPWGRLGYLQSLMFRATRLVVDSGLHAKRWSREQAIKYMVDTLGDEESNLTTEVERYCVWPGQASSYKVGHAKWEAVRAKAKQRLGSRFDIRQFHDAALLAGGMPLEVLENRIDAWVASQA